MAKFKHLQIPTHWEHYWSKYPEGFTILEAIITWVSQVNEMTNNVNDWNNYLDDFVAQFDKELRGTVENTLKDWQNSGFLDIVINTALETQIDELQENTDRKLDEFQHKLNNKMDRTQLIGMSSLTQEVKEAMTGGSVAVLGDDMVLHNNIVDGQVYNEKTSFFEPTRNLFNKRTAIPNTIIGPLTGELVPGDRWTSDKIYTKPNTTYTKNTVRTVAFYDVNDNFIVSYADSYTFTTTANTHYIRVEAPNPDSLQVEEGEETTPYIGYYSNLSEEVNVRDVNLKISEWGTTNLPIRITTTPRRITIPHNVSVFTANERIRVPTTRTEPYEFDIDPPNDNWVILFDKLERDFLCKQYSTLVGNFNPDSYVIIGVFFASQMVFSSMSQYYIDDKLFGIESGVSISPTEPTNEFPNRLTWGNEYLHGWYKKLIEKQPVTMVWAGDSTTNQESSISDPNYRRNALGKQILVKGGYDENLITSLNKGHGGNTTEDWLNNWLEEDLAENPDLYILAYGLNDGGTNYYNTSIEERIEGFETRLRQGLDDIRNERGLSADDLPIILCTPVATNDPTNGRTPEQWNNLITPIIKQACRDYQCAFIDINAYQYDRKFSSEWSNNGDNVHPDYIATIDYMSLFKDLLMPYLIS